MMLEIASCAAEDVVISACSSRRFPPTSLVGSPGPKRDRARCCRPAVSGSGNRRMAASRSGNVDPEDCSSSSALFFLTSGMNIVGLIGGGVLLCSDAFGGRDTLLLAGAPILLGVGATSATLALPVVPRRSLLRRWPRWLVDVSAGIEAACRSLLKPSWRLLGAVGYLGFDIAVLGVLFAACGHPIPIDALVSATSSATSATPSRYRAASAHWRQGWPERWSPTARPRPTRRRLLSPITRSRSGFRASAGLSATCFSAAASRVKENTRGRLMSRSAPVSRRKPRDY